jgi:hypothetical protein
MEATTAIAIMSRIDITGEIAFIERRNLVMLRIFLLPYWLILRACALFFID